MDITGTELRFMDGYFKIHRKILDSQVFAHPIALKIWIWILSRVNYSERFVPFKINRGETTVKLLPGQFIFGRFKAEEELNIDGSTIYKWIQKFSTPDFDMIKIESNSHYSIITVCNWEQYQNGECNNVTTIEQPSNNQVTAKEQPCNTDNKDKKDNKVKNIEEKELAFKSEVYEYMNKYPVSMLDQFCDYWTEKNRTKTKMLFETKQTFEISKRLATWASRDKTFSKPNRIDNTPPSIVTLTTKPLGTK